MRPLLITIITITETVPLVHAVAFWTEHGGIVGWLWAPVSLAITLFFWITLTGATRYILGIAASALLLAAPLYQVAAPLTAIAAKTAAIETARAQRLETLHREIATLQTQRETYLRNSETRHGWLAPLQQNNDAIGQLNAEIATLTAQPRNTEQPAFIIALQLAALVLFHVAAVVALGKLRRNTRETPAATVATSPATPATPPPEPAQPETAAQRIANRIKTGDYGTTPSVRKIIEVENVRHPVVAQAFEQLLQSGIVRRNGNRYELTTAVSPA